MTIKRELKIVALVISFAMILATATETFALTNTEPAEPEETSAKTIETITGTESINAETYSTQESIAVADGKDAEIVIPRDGEDVIAINDGDGSSLEMSLPEEAEDTEGVLTENGTIVYENEEASATIGVQPLKEEINGVNFESVRTTVNIEDATAAKEYTFDFNLANGSELVTAKEYLGTEYDTGEAYIVDVNGEIQYVIDPAWAKDANGDNIETYYTTSGNTLTQVVNFDENTAFPVVADPTAWQVTKCAAAIGAVVVSTAFGAAKILKIKKYIKAAGGVKKAASGVIKAIKIAKKTAKAKGSKKWWKYVNISKISSSLGRSIGNLCAEILGISEIQSKCSF